MPTNLTIKFLMSKKMSENFTELGLQSYYKSLTKSEKSSLIEYLMVKFGYRYASLQSKLSGKHFLNKRDLILIGEVIQNESWKQQ